ncbi:probable LRR receptor-like serine/threonine-protein kinase At1g56130 isoform X6 [Mangifera indica]|uniref:probable LRR receptor-like serine/threonine-protein kinase At1g56130 isoform X6 n=1 Tax=Mangifera indica TaxID=29780 RepID=UPI001CF94690|nr:probable LRR receptor-like serine/threonine-protein kinase At1g56130 isoform X6 [Mangifera indica]
MFFRNVVINVSMPFDIEEYRSLQTMDLVFNNLIVKFQVLCSALILLFLGNNGLSGTIPQQKAVYLKNIILPGLNCLQRNFPCSKNAPCYSSFAI